MQFVRVDSKETGTDPQEGEEERRGEFEIEQDVPVRWCLTFVPFFKEVAE